MWHDEWCTFSQQMWRLPATISGNAPRHPHNATPKVVSTFISINMFQWKFQSVFKTYLSQWFHYWISVQKRYINEFKEHKILLKKIFVLLVISTKLKRLINIAIFWGLTPCSPVACTELSIYLDGYICTKLRRQVLAKCNINTAARNSNPIKTNRCSKIENIRQHTSKIISRINTTNRKVHLSTWTKLVVIKNLLA
jgi:hypothetical protein